MSPLRPRCLSFLFSLIHSSSCRSLSGLSDRELLSRVKDLVARERAVTLEILVHLIEVERRRLHVGLGYASMFDYCTRHLGYSSSAAARRIQHGPVSPGLPGGPRTPREERGEPEHGVFGLLDSHAGEPGRLLSRIRGKSQKEVEAIVADYRPPVSLRDRAKPVWVAVPSSGPSGPETGNAGALSSAASSGTDTGDSSLFSSASRGERGPEAPITGSESRGSDSADPGDTASTQRTSRCDYSRCGSEKTPNSARGTVRLEKKRFVQFVASEQFVKKLEKAKALLSNGRGDLSYERVLEAALDEFLKDHDPEERNKRREERKQKAAAGSGSVDGRLFRRRAGDGCSLRGAA